MAVEFLNAAFDQEIPSSQKLVLLALSNYANEHGICYPSITTLMKKTSLKKDAVIRSLKFLIDANIVCKIDNSHVSKKYLKRENQNCYQLNILKSKPAANNDQSFKQTGRFKIPEPVALNDQLPVAQSDLNHHIKPSVKPSIEKINKKETSPQPKRETTDQWLARVEEFKLTPELLAWGASQTTAWTADEMQVHYEFYLDYLENVPIAKRKKSLAAQFRNAVRGNWANIRRVNQAKSWQQQNIEATERAKQNFLKMVGGENGDAKSNEIDYFD